MISGEKAQWFAATALIQNACVSKACALGWLEGQLFQLSCAVARSTYADGSNDSRNNSSGSPKKQSDGKGRETRGAEWPIFDSLIEKHPTIIFQLSGGQSIDLKIKRDRTSAEKCTLLQCNLPSHSKKRLFEHITCTIILLHMMMKALITFGLNLWCFKS